LGVAEHRRKHSLNQFWDVGLDVTRFPAMNKSYVRDQRGHESAGLYALALTQKLLLRRASQLEAASVLIFEDDVILHPDWREKVDALELPEDWGLFYFGCQHRESPELVASGLVRVRRAWDLHAVAIRREYYSKVMAVLTPAGKKTPVGRVKPNDKAIAELMAEIPTYAAYPNLAWQQEQQSSVSVGWFNDNYARDGVQRRCRDKLRGNRLGLSPTRAIYWWPQKTNFSFSDRLQSLGGMLAFADWSERGLVGYWPLENRCADHFEEVFALPKGLQIFPDKLDWARTTQGVVDYRYALNLTPEQLYVDLRKNDFLTEDITQEAFLGKYREKLSRLLPSAQLSQKLGSFGDRFMKGEEIGLHIASVSLGPDGAVQEDALREAVLSEWSKSVYQRAILVCGDAQAEKTWQAFLTQNGIPSKSYMGVWPQDPIESGVAESAVALLLLARCKTILTGGGSSLPQLAADLGRASLVIVKPVTEPRVKRGLKANSTPPDASSLKIVPNSIQTTGLQSVDDFKIIDSANLLQKYELPLTEVRAQLLLNEKSEQVRAWFNPAVVMWKGKRLMAYRTESLPFFKWSRISIVELSVDFEPIEGTGRLLPLQTRFDEWGAEDPRFFTLRSDLWLSYNDGIGMGLARLSDAGDVIESNLFPKEIPSGTPELKEKNWGFFEAEGLLWASYSVSPHEVKEISIKEWDFASKVFQNKWSPPPEVRELHGGSNAVLHNSLFWRVVHDFLVSGGADGNRTYRLWMMAFDPKPPFAVRFFTRQPILMACRELKANDALSPHNVVFCSSLERVENGWLLAFGQNDIRCRYGVVKDAALEAYWISVS
jgi:hypothetical protein